MMCDEGFPLAPAIRNDAAQEQPIHAARVLVSPGEIQQRRSENVTSKSLWACGLLLR
jgi:hypothetical protein